VQNVVEVWMTIISFLEEISSRISMSFCPKRLSYKISLNRDFYEDILGLPESHDAIWSIDLWWLFN